MKKPVIIVIGGPTASGKTSQAIKVAKALNTEIINADSRQIYRELNIGVAKPSAEELASIPHHFVGTVPLDQHFSAGDFAIKGRIILDSLLAAKAFAVVSGGTGLYIKALLEGFDDLPQVSPALREKVNALHAEKGLDGLCAKLLLQAPEAAKHIDMKNPARVKRALELVWENGDSLDKLWQGEKTEPTALILGYYLDIPRDELYDRINHRVDAMLEQGLEKEAHELHPQKSLKALQTVGYSEFFDFFEGKADRKTAIERIKQHTRNYAKRQVTWFKNQTTYKAVHPDDLLSLIFADLNLHGYTVHQ